MITPELQEVISSLISKVNNLEKVISDLVTQEGLPGSYADEDAQDAVGTILVDSATVDFSYVDATPSITADVKNNSITYAKMQNIATDSLIGRDTVGSGDPETIGLNATLSMDGSGNLQRSALTGDVTANAGSNATTIGNNKVLTAMIADAQVTLAKMTDLAQATIIGRAAAAGTGVPTALSAAQVVAIINSTLDHGTLAGLGDDDHNQYALLAGRSGGQVWNGGNAANEDVTINGTSHATKTSSYVLLQTGGGFVGIGLLVPLGEFHQASSGTASTRGSVFSQHNTGAQGALQNFLKSRGSAGTPTVVANGDFIAAIFAQPYDGSAYLRTAGMAYKVNGTVASGSIPTDLVFAAGAVDDGSFAANERLRINSAGDGGLGTIGTTAAARWHVIENTLGDPVQILQSTATNDDPKETVYQGRAATTNNTVTTLLTLTVPASTTYMVEAMVVARRTGGSSGTAEDGAGYVVRATVKNVAGTATLIGAVSATYTAEDQAGWDATLDVTGTTVRVRVTGATNNNITWHCTARVWPVGS